MYKQKLWYISIGITVISLVIIIIGFVKAMNFAPVPATSQNNSTPQNTSNSAAKELLRIIPMLFIYYSWEIL